MFQQISIKGRLGEDPRTLELIDSTFTYTGSLDKPLAITIAREVFTFVEYKKRKLAIAKNLARLYMTYNYRDLEHLVQWMMADASIINKELPELGYEKYQHCIANHIRQLYAGKRHDN